jgi:hypothetical protein
MFPQINISSIQNYQGLFLAGHLLVWQICALNWDFYKKALRELYVSGFDGSMSKYL